MEKIQKYIRKFCFLIVLALSLPATWSLFVRGYYGASDDLHIAWLYEMDRSLNLGQFPPRFVPDLSFGFGYPLFNFVFPLPFYVGEIFHKFGFSFVGSVKAVFLISVPLSMYFMYKFLKEHTNDILALAGGVLYVYTPYRATDLYVRGAIGEIFTFIFPPLSAWAITKIGKKKSIKWIGVLALSVAGLILSHNIMAYIFIPFLVLLAIVEGKKISKIFWGFFLGFLISMHFWLPALVESKLMEYDTVFNFLDHFPTIRQLITPYFGYGASVPGPHDGMSFFLGTINILLVFVALIFFKRNKGVIYWSLFAIFVSIFMMNFRSTFFWNSIPFLPYFQFPWRFLSLATFATAVLVLIFDKFKYGKYFGAVIAIGAVLLNFNYFKPHDFLGRTDNYYINRFIPVPVASSEYFETSEEYLRLPKGVKNRPNSVSPDTGISKIFEVKLDKDIVYNYYKYNFPGWKAYIDNKPVEIKTGEPYGQIIFNVPSGEHKIRIEFKETFFRSVLNIISFVGLVYVFIMIFKKEYEK